MDSIKLKIYKTNIGIFIKDNGIGSYSSSTQTEPSSWMKNLRFNGKEINHLRNGYGLLKDQDITSLKKKSYNRTVMTHMTLKDPSIAESLKVPLDIKDVEFIKNYDEEFGDYYTTNNPELNKVISLYKPVFETIKGDWEEVDFTLEIIDTLEINNYSEPEKMTIKLFQKNGFSEKVVSVYLAEAATYTDIEKLLTPEFLLHKRPCQLTSPQMYKIVRAYVLENIDRKYAKITSNYDFCFSVSKLIPIKPFETKTELKTKKGKSYAKPKFKTKTFNDKEVKIFEMTDSVKNYSGYTPIKALHADSLEDLSDRLKHYLDELMAVINQPLRQCECCNGLGHIFEKFNKEA